MPGLALQKRLVTEITSKNNKDIRFWFEDSDIKQEYGANHMYFIYTVYISYYEALIPVANIKPTLK